MIGLEKNWDTIAKPFGAMTDQLRDALLKYGGAQGQLAVQRYDQGFNTITQDLLDKTKAAMDQAYQQTVQDALKYLGDQAQETNDKISKLIEAIDQTKSDIVTMLTGILGALTNKSGTTTTPGATTPSAGGTSDAWATYYAAVEAWQAQLQQVLDQGGPAAAQEWEQQNPPPQPPAADTGGLVSVHDGEAILNRSQTAAWSDLVVKMGDLLHPITPGMPGPVLAAPMNMGSLLQPATAKQPGAVVNMSFPGAIITGVNSAAEFVRQCLVELKRRGVRIENPGY